MSDHIRDNAILAAALKCIEDLKEANPTKLNGKAKKSEIKDRAKNNSDIIDGYLKPLQIKFSVTKTEFKTKIYRITSGKE